MSKTKEQLIKENQKYRQELHDAEAENQRLDELYTLAIKDRDRYAEKAGGVEEEEPSTNTMDIFVEWLETSKASNHIGGDINMALVVLGRKTPIQCLKELIDERKIEEEPFKEGEFYKDCSDEPLSIHNELTKNARRI